jgi:Glycosyl transferase family 2
MSAPLISVVMSVYNGDRYLAEAVESILNQSFGDFEFIVIDDGSTDRSAFLLAEYRRSDPRVQVHHQANRGLVESLNRGCGLARGKYIARMDADDIAVSDRFMRQVDFMERHPEVGVVGGAVEFINGDGRSLGISALPTEDRKIKAGLLHNCVIVHPTVLMRREAVLSLGAYRKIVVDAEDYDLWLRVAEKFQLANLEQVVLKRRYHSSQVSVMKRRQQVLSVLAAHAAAATRREGKPDPLQSLEQITPLTLTALGVSEIKQHAAVAREYLGRIQNLASAGEESAALELFSEVMTSSDYKAAENWVIADLQLFAARLYWRDARLASSFLAAGRAILRRPVLLGRPIKQLYERLVS